MYIDLRSLTSRQGFAILGASAGDQSGVSISRAGDINADGIDDVVIGASRSSPLSRNQSGSSYVVYGKPGGYSSYIDLARLTSATGIVAFGASAGDQSGVSISRAGDINADGIDDVVIGASRSSPLSRNQSGSSYVVYGKSGGYSSYIDLAKLTSTTGIVAFGASAGDQSGVSINGACDVNADGIDDILIGAAARSPLSRTYAGSAYVIYGRKSGYSAYIDMSKLSVSTGFEIVGASVTDRAGISISGAGDINADGIGDIIIGAAGRSPLGRAYAGSAYVIYGKRGGYSGYIDLAKLSATQGFEIVGASARDFTGISVSGAGDINADGIDDIVIGASERSPLGRAYAGSAYVVYGKRGGYSSYIDLAKILVTQGFEIAGASAGDSTGISVSGAGDINADGIYDVVIGASERSPFGRTYSGSAYIVYGKRGGYSSYIDLAKISSGSATNGLEIAGGNSGDNTGISVSGAGDINADGIDDIMIGAFGASPSMRNQAGMSYVVYGSQTTDDLSGHNNTFLEIDAI